ncbi:unnamed protein product [Rotaria sp. Silwood2]|nr:unnamed protein product [Rotaria sp. Silwood2]
MHLIGPLLTNYILPCVDVPGCFLSNGENRSIAKYSDPTFATDPRTRSYHAYREWQRLSALKDAESIPMRDSSKRRDQEK